MSNEAARGRTDRHGRKARRTGRGVLFAVLLVLAGCASMQAPQTYDLSAPREQLGTQKGRGLLIVSEPASLQALDSTRILLISRDNSLAYLPDAQWSDRLPKLLQSRLIQTFENAKRLQQIGRPGDRLVPSAQLNWEIRSFGIRESGNEAVVEVSVKIVGDRTGRIQDGRIFRQSLPVGATDAVSSVAALDLATQNLLREIVRWAGGRI